MTGPVVIHSSVPIPLRVYLNPLHLIRTLWPHRELIGRLIAHEVIGRYRGSLLGILWSFLTPVLMLAVFTLVFVVIWRAPWLDDPRPMVFTVGLFCGLIIYNLFSECVGRAPVLILQHVNFVKRVVFPLEILPVVCLGSALVHAGISLVPLLVIAALWTPPLTWHVLFIPIVFLELSLLTVGLSWLLAALGVFVRDTPHAVTVILQLLFFASPVFWPLQKAVDPTMRFLVRLNPLANIIDGFRQVVMAGSWPEWDWFAATGVFCLLVAQAGYAGFMKSKPAFADVM